MAYGKLCAEFYDLERPTAQKQELATYLRYAKEAKGAICEPMCGTGRFLIPLLQQGYSVEGFDLSSHMLQICRKKCAANGISAVLEQADFSSVSLHGPYALIFIPSGSFCHLITSQEIAQALQWIKTHLIPGGKFVFEIEDLNSIRESGIRREKKLGDITRKVITYYDIKTRIETGHFEYESPTCTETEEFYVRHYAPGEVETLLTQAGFQILNKHGSPYECGVYESNCTIL